MTFHEWLAKQSKRNSPLGDLARDAQVDKKAGEVENTKQAWRNHLGAMSACWQALKTFDKAWSSYRRALLRK